MNKLNIIFILFVILFIPFVSAGITTSVADAVPVSSNLSIEVSANQTASCTSKIFSNNGSNLLTSNLNQFNVNDTILIKKGIYKIKVNCSDMSVYSKIFFVTKTGELPASDSLTIFIYLIFGVALMGVILTIFLSIINFTSMDIRLMLTSMGFYILLMFSIFMASTYLINTFIENLATIFIAGTSVSNFILPVIALIVTNVLKNLEAMKPENRGGDDF